MNDRYLFRAKQIDNGEFVEGLLTIMCGQFQIINPDDENTAYPIDESTICQCTGLKDKNGKLIWENDVTLRTSVTGTHKGKIIYSSDGSFCQKDFETTFENLLIHSDSYFEVIGNIFDNPELMYE